MAFPSNSQNNMLEGFSTNRAPFFNGVDFPYWKIRMETYLQSIDYDLWHIVSNGPYIPKHVINGVEVLKTYEAYDENDKKMLSKNAKAKYALICGLDRDVFKNIEQASTAHDMWKMLEVTHQGTSAMKETKIQIYSTQYENFKMKADETIANMYTRFTTITNGLNSLGKVLTQKDMVTKILRSLTKAYQGKVVAIQEAKDLSTLPLEELIGSLMNHEIFMSAQEEEEVEKKKKTIAFKSSSSRAISEDDEDSVCSDMEDLALFTKKYKKFMKFKKNFEKKPYRGNDSKERKSKDDPPICFECKKPGHMKMDCPMRKKNKYKGRAMLADWLNSDEEDSDKEEKNEVANMCMMALDDGVSISSQSDCDSENDEDNLEIPYDELSSSFKDLFNDFGKLLAKNQTLREKTNMLLKEIEILKLNEKELLTKSQCTTCSSYKKEISELHNNIKSLKNDIYTFTRGKEGYELMLGSQSCGFGKSGIGYDPSRKQKFLRNFFVKTSSLPHFTCTYCNQDGHTISYCNMKKYAHLGKTKWVPKVPKTNKKGPKVMWVPKANK